jgi:hypothetical protein
VGCVSHRSRTFARASSTAFGGVIGLVPYFDAKFGEIITKWTKRAGAFPLGRKTYEILQTPGPSLPIRRMKMLWPSTPGRSSLHPGRSIRSTGKRHPAQGRRCPGGCEAQGTGRRRDSGPRQRQPHPNPTSARSRRYLTYLVVSCLCCWPSRKS